MSVTALHPHPLVPVVYRDRSERTVEAVGTPVPDFMMESGFRLCGSCGDWCQPVAVDPDVQCSRCLFQALEAALTRGIHLKENPAELAARIYGLLVPAPRPTRAS